MLSAARAYFQKQICPYCFESYSLTATPFRCGSPASVCAQEVDPVRQAKWRDSTPVGRVVPHNGFTRSVRCPHCNHETRKRLCPSCQMELPQTTGDCRNLIFAVIGTSEVGKSHYI